MSGSMIPRSRREKQRVATEQSESGGCLDNVIG